MEKGVHVLTEMVASETKAQLRYEERLQYLTEKEVAQLTRRALQTLRNERAAGKGIPYIKVGRSVRYSLADVIRHMEERKVKTTEN